MIDISHSEAQLFRILAAFFGRDNIIPRMRVIAVCGGRVPAALGDMGIDIDRWARNNRCLFTIVNGDGDPCMVMEFFGGFKGGIVDSEEVEHQQYLSPLLAACGIRYVTINKTEFTEILDPDSDFDICAFLKLKIEQSGVVL